MRRQTALLLLATASLLVSACSNVDNARRGTYILTVNSSNPSNGISIGITSAANNSTTQETTSFSHAYNAGASFALTAPALSGINSFSSWSGCASTSGVSCAVTLRADTTVAANYVTPAITTPAVTVTPSSSNITTKDALSVVIAMTGPRGQATPSGTVTLTSGTYSSPVTPLSSGSVQIDIPANALGAGSDTLKAVFTPDAASAAIYNQASGLASVTVTVPPKITPTILVTLASYTVSTAQSIVVAITVKGGDVTPTGTVMLAGGGYTSTPASLSDGVGIISVPAGSLAPGSDTLVASFAPDSAGSSIYTAATGTSSAVTVAVATLITVDPSSLGPAITDQILGMNMVYWYDPSTPAIIPAFETAGIKAIRWPGGSAANDYHWATNSMCDGEATLPADAFDTFVADVIQPGQLDVALGVSYATDAACTGPGDPAEAAAWVLDAKNKGGRVSHVTVGNEDWGAWEPDLHATQHDPTTYATATANEYYPQIKTADPNVLIGIGVNPYNPTPWDPIVLSQAKYDFVEYHFYPQGPGAEDDTFLVQQGAQQLTAAIETIKAELTTAGSPSTPIFIGEIGSVYNDPGKQTSSITQALYAGQALGEMMNEGISRATWWLGFGGCTSDPSADNFAGSLYGWQNFGGYMVFSDGLPEPGCAGSAIPSVPAGTLLPTARAFQLFSNVAVDGETVLTAKVAGNTTDIRVYAATHSGGTALVLFNLNESASEAVSITLSGQSAASSVTVETYSKAIYDQSKNNVWAAPTSVDFGAQSFPMALILDPWSMNVVILK